MAASKRGFDDGRVAPHWADEHYALGVFRRFVIAVWRRETRVEGVAALSALIAECADDHPRGIGLLQIIEDSAVPPSWQARTALAQMHGEQAERIRRSALVYTRPGFAGAAVRAVMTGVAMLNPPRFPHELFSELQRAALWLEQECESDGASTVSAALASAATELRQIKQLTAPSYAVLEPLTPAP